MLRPLDEVEEAAGAVRLGLGEQALRKHDVLDRDPDGFENENVGVARRMRAAVEKRTDFAGNLGLRFSAPDSSPRMMSPAFSKQPPRSST